MLANNFVENIPNFGAFLLDHLFGALNGGHMAALFELVVNKGFEKLQRHLLGEPALVEAKLGSHHDNRTAGIVDSLSQEVLSEASSFSFEHVTQRFERAPILTGDRPAAAPVIEQSVHGFLQHPLL